MWYYEIIVSLHGQHFFATASRSLPGTNPEKLREVLASLLVAFPTKMGYDIQVHEYKQEGQIRSVADILNRVED